MYVFIKTNRTLHLQIFLLSTSHIFLILISTSIRESLVSQKNIRTTKSREQQKCKTIIIVLIVTALVYCTETGLLSNSLCVVQKVKWSMDICIHKTCYASILTNLKRPIILKVLGEHNNILYQRLQKKSKFYIIKCTLFIIFLSVITTIDVRLLCFKNENKLFDNVAHNFIRNCINKQYTIRNRVKKRTESHSS